MRSVTRLASGLLLAVVVNTSMAAIASAATNKHCGHASWYALTSITASGERMDPQAMTAAHRKLPFGTKLLVTNKRSGRSTVVRINDRGPFIKGRIIDLSKGAADRLGMVHAGVAEVCLEVMP